MNEKEAALQRRCQNIIRKYGGYIFKNNGNIYTESGRPDLTGCIPITVDDFVKIFGTNKKIGLFIGLELKRSGHLSEVSEAQKIVGQKIKNAGGLWFAIDNSDIVEALMLKLTGGNYEL